MEIRPTTPADLQAQHEVFREAIGEVFRRHSFDPPDPPLEAFVAQQGHLLEHDGERCFVAEEDGRIVGFSAAMARGDTWYLSSLFVAPDHQATGLGQRLLERSWGDSYARRLTMTDSIQPVSNGLYARRGLIPTTPVLNLAGRPSNTVLQGYDPHGSGALGSSNTVLQGLEPSEPSAEALAALDLAGYGFPRAIDHAYWSRHARATLWLRDGEPVAYSYAWANGRIGPLAALDGAAGAGALRGELARRPGEPSVVAVPGTSAELVGEALAAGLRITGPPALLLLSQPANPPRALAISGYSLF